MATYAAHTGITEDTLGYNKMSTTMTVFLSTLKTVLGKVTFKITKTKLNKVTIISRFTKVKKNSPIN